MKRDRKTDHHFVPDPDTNYDASDRTILLTEIWKTGTILDEGKNQSESLG